VSIEEALHERDVQDLLIHHRQKLQLAFDNLGRVLGSPTSCSVPGFENSTQTHNKPYSHPVPCHDRPGRPETAAVPPPAHPLQLEQSVSDSLPPEDRLAESSQVREEDISVEATNKPASQTKQAKNMVNLLMVKLQRGSKAIHKFINQSEDDALSLNDAKTEDDPRLDDIERVEGPITPSMKLKAWLARFSFAKDYLTWAVARYSVAWSEILTLEGEDADTAKGNSVILANIYLPSSQRIKGSTERYGTG
jgi:hypothetical protein